VLNKLSWNSSNVSALAAVWLAIACATARISRMSSWTCSSAFLRSKRPRSATEVKQNAICSSASLGRLHSTEVVTAAKQVEPRGRNILSIVAKLLEARDPNPQRTPFVVTAQSGQIAAIAEHGEAVVRARSKNVSR
jgi:hypothetical protein